MTANQYLDTILVASRHCDPATLADFTRGLRAMDLGVLHFLYVNGVEVRLFVGPITDQPEMNHLAGQVTGDGRAWETPQGAYDPTSRVAFASCTQFAHRGVLFHEIAHAVDFLHVHVENRPDFQHAFLTERANSMSPDNPYYHLDFEFFAEAFAALYTSDFLRGELARHSPLTYVFLTDVIDGLNAAAIGSN
jgi:hypothetical protein